MRSLEWSKARFEKLGVPLPLPFVSFVSERRYMIENYLDFISLVLTDEEMVTFAAEFKEATDKLGENEEDWERYAELLNRLDSYYESIDNVLGM